MKKIIAYIVTVILIGTGGPVVWASLASLEKVSKQFLPNAPTVFLKTELEGRQEDLDRLQKEKVLLEGQSKEYLSSIRASIEEVNNQITQLKEKLKVDSENELFIKKVTLLDELHDILKKREQSWEQLFTSLDQHIKQLSMYLNDLDFKKFKENKLETKQIYSFEDLQNVYQIIVDHEKQLENLVDQEKHATTEFESRKRSALVTLHEFKKRKDARELLQKESSDSSLDEDQLNKLWTLQEKIFDEKKRLDQQEIEESENKLELVKLRLFTSRREIEVLKKVFREMKPSVRVSEADVSIAHDDLAKKKQKSNVIKRDYYHDIEQIKVQLQQKRSELEQLSRRYNIALDNDLDQWSREPKQTVDNYVGAAHVGFLNDTILLLQRKKDYLKALIDLEDEKIHHEEASIKIKETFHKIRYRKFISEDELNQEIKKYEILKSSFRAIVSSLQEKKNIATSLLDIQKKAQENIKKIIENIKKQQLLIFKTRAKEYKQAYDFLINASHTIQEQIEVFNKVNAVYADTLTVITNTSKQIEFITAELSSITIWHRPEHAVSWEGLNNSFANIETFVFDLRNYLVHFNATRFAAIMYAAVHSPISWLLFAIKMCALILSLFLARAYLPKIMNVCRALGNTYVGIRAFSFILVFLGGFFIRHFGFIMPWVTLCAALTFASIPDNFVYIFFYLLSIIYLVYLAQRLIAYFIEFNEQHNYVFINKDFQTRFVWVLSVLLYATIIIVFFREAFLLGNYPRSELPTILLAINFIILQIALISLISKEQIVSLIPKNTPTWQWIYDQIDRYYYVLIVGVVTVIVMSNPYVGFGRLVLYLLRRVVYTTGLILLLIWIHQIIRKSFSHIFFLENPDDITKERFSNAKTWYGLTVIMIFLVFALLGLIFTAKIWGWPEQLTSINHASDIKVWLQEPFLLRVDNHPSISVWTILVLITFILSAVGVSFAINRFVLGKIFDILLIDSGVQNTVSSIIYYCIFLIAIFLGFNAVNLGSLVIYIMGALILGIGWVVKEPISDFVSYFVILVQRPLKVGDFIKIDDELLGVVRKITPRTVILRRKNSITIILPNSFIVNKPITNWNYVRGFIAHNDIMLTVSYKTDPNQVQKILHEVLAENPYILKNPRPIVRLDNFSTEGYVFMVRGFLSSNYTLDQWDIASDVRLAIVKALRTHNIELAVPTRIVFDKKSAENSHFFNDTPSLDV